MTKVFKIYSLNCPISKKIKYIGKTMFSLQKRLGGHMRDRNKCHKTHWIKHLYLQKLYPEIKLIKICDNERRCNYAESFFIKLYGRNDLGLGELLNHTNGGDGSSGFKHSEETKSKLRQRKLAPRTEESRKRQSLLTKGIPKTEEHKRKISLGHIGLKPSEETRRKLRESLKGRIAWNKGLTGFVKSEQTIQKLKGINKGRKLSEEHKRKIGKRSLGRKHSEESKEKMRQWRMGKKLSEETKIKIGKRHVARNHSENTKRKISEKALGRKSWKKGFSRPDQINYKTIKTILSIFTSHILNIGDRSARRYLKVA